VALRLGHIERPDPFGLRRSANEFTVLLLAPIVRHAFAALHVPQLIRKEDVEMPTGTEASK